MKKYFIPALMALLLSFPLFNLHAVDEGDNIPIEITIRPTRDTDNRPTNRVPALIPIEAYYDGNMSSIVISFTRDLGDVEVAVTNMGAGEFVETSVNAAHAPAVIPVSGANGLYTIDFVLSTGASYFGSFEK